MTFLCDNPWLFHRDEVDLLEEEMDDLYREQDAAAKGKMVRMEDLVLQEQMETEERSDAELAGSIGDGSALDVSSGDGHAHFDSGEDLPSSLREELEFQSERDPVYEHLYVWAQRVFAYTTQRYVIEGLRDEDVFRAHVNVKMVPIKFVAALCEFVPGDPIAEHIAAVERDLCFTYLTRTIDSLEHRSFLGDDEATPFVQEGRELEDLARTHLSHQ